MVKTANVYIQVKQLFLCIKITRLHTSKTQTIPSLSENKLKAVKKKEKKTLGELIAVISSFFLLSFCSHKDKERVAYGLLNSGASLMLISTISTALKPSSSVAIVDCESTPDPAWISLNIAMT